MIIPLNERLKYNDLSYEYIENLKTFIAEVIKNDVSTMTEIKNLCEETEDNMLYKIDEIVEKAVESIKIYCEFDVEVKIK